MNYNIQYLRAVAAIATVAFHVIVTSYNYGYDYPNFFNVKQWGGYGVDLFFVISGYIIVYIQDKSNKNISLFLKNRFLRIIPTYYFLTTFYIFLLVFFPNLIKWSSNFELNSTILESYLFYSTWFENSPLVYVGWSIEYEIYFYLIFSISILLKNFVKEYYFTLIIIIILFLIFDLQLFVLEFCLGILVFILTKKYKINKSISFLIFLLGVIIFVINIKKVEELDRLFRYGVPSFLIILGSINLREYRLNFFKLLGDASYSIYLIQVFTVSFVFKVISFFSVKGYDFVFFSLNVIFTVIVGLIFYIIFEKKILKFKYLNTTKHKNKELN